MTAPLPDPGALVARAEELAAQGNYTREDILGLVGCVGHLCALVRQKEAEIERLMDVDRALNAARTRVAEFVHELDAAEAEIERLKQERDRAKELARGYYNEAATAYERRNATELTLTKVRQRLVELKQRLGDALDEWADSAQYKGAYLTNKHGDAESIAEHRAFLATLPQEPKQSSEDEKEEQA